LTAGPVTINGEAILMIEQPNENATVMVLGAELLSIDGNDINIASPDWTFEMQTDPRDTEKHDLSNVEPVQRPLDPPTVGPAVNTFTDSMKVTLTTTSKDAVIRYTTETPRSRINEFRRAAQQVGAGVMPAPDAAERLALHNHETGAGWKLYTRPFEITADTCGRARTFRKGVTHIPNLISAGTDVSEISYGFFSKQPMSPGLKEAPAELQPGLNYDYMEGRWFALWTYTNLLPAKKSGTTDSLMDVSMRETDDPFAVRYTGYIDIPADGVYTFYGPDEFINNDAAPGYDLRVYVDVQEWDLGQTWHGRGMWSVPLEKGLHEFMVTFADARAKELQKQRIDLWSNYPYPETTWKGTVPKLEVSGPGLKRQTVPAGWLKRGEKSKKKH